MRAGTHPNSLANLDAVRHMTHEGRRKAARERGVVSGATPYGYRHGRDGVLVPCPGEAERVPAIFRQYLRWRSLKTVQRWLAEEGILPRRARAWSHEGLAFLLHNDTYLGRAHYADVNVKAQHKPLVAPIVFYKVRALLWRNNKRKVRRRAAS